MINSVPNFKLNNGVEIPVIGFGPMIFGYGKSIHTAKGFWSIPQRAYNKFITRPIEKHHYVNMVTHALNSGFHLLDFSASYGNERFIGEAIADCDVQRKDLFIIARICSDAQWNDCVRESFDTTLKNLGIDYVDCLQFHWPQPSHYLRTWKDMEAIYNDGLARSLGVANCHQHHIERILEMCDIKPAVNQIEVHPLLNQKELVLYCQSQDILVQAYTPIARNDERISRLPKMRALCNKYGKSIAQIVLRWHIQNGICPVVRSMNKNRQIENLDIFDFHIEEEDMMYIDSININSRLRFDPDNCDYSIL